ncbi:unnamed protein product [Ixodes pacificus]
MDILVQNISKCLACLFTVRSRFMKAECSRMFISSDVILLRWRCCLHGTSADASHESRFCAFRVATPGEGNRGLVVCNKGVSVRHLPELDLHASYLFLFWFEI